MNDKVPKSAIWYEQPPNDKSWAMLWSGYIICGKCRGIRRSQGACQVCGDLPFPAESQLVRDAAGREFRVPIMVSMGAEGRYEDWVYLQMMEREWKRPVLPEDNFPGSSQARARLPGRPLSFSFGVILKPGFRVCYAKDFAKLHRACWTRYSAGIQQSEHA